MPAEKLAALIAPPLVQRAATGSPAEPGLLARGPASVLYVALDGIQALAERLLAGGRAGQDALRRTLDALFGALEETLAEHGAEVLQFGDQALIAVLRPDVPRIEGLPADDVERAFACALALQARAAAFLALQLPGGTSLPAPRIGVGAGEHLDLCLGRAALGLYYAGLGSALDEALAAHGMARAGEVVAGSGALGLALGMAELGLRTSFGLVAGTSLPESGASAGRGRTEQPCRDDEGALEAYLPPALLGRIKSGAGLRPASTRAAFLALRCPVPGAAPAAVDRLCAYLSALIAVAAQHGGWLQESLVAGERLALLLIFEHAANAQSDALRCAQAARALGAQQAWLEGQQLAVAAGNVFAGAFGSARRRAFVAAGAPLVEARRLAAIAPPGTVWLAAPDAEHAQAFVV